LRREPLAAHTKTKAPFPISLLFEVKLFYWVALVIMVVSVAAGAFAANQTTNKNNSSTATPPPSEATETPVQSEGRQVKTYAAEPQVSIDSNKKYTATISVARVEGETETPVGEIHLELFADKAPHAVNNFVFLARDGFYDGLTFFRVIPGFVAQAGDPTCTTDLTVTCTGSGGPGYFLTREDSGQVHDAGVLAMGAPQGGEEISGSQFYITYAPESHLDGRDTVFGRVVAGQDVLDSLAPSDPSDPTAQTGDKIVSITIEET
jgi:cyclophilin family peptidyl-prolyl cis-trans isomerase